MKDKCCSCVSISDWVMRIVLALVFLTASYGKLALMGVENFAAGSGLPVFVGWLVALGELGGGIGILVGGLVAKQDPKSWVTRASGGVLALVMLGAIFLVKWSGFEAGFLAGLQAMYVDLALFALALHYFLSGNACYECTICKTKK